MDIRNEVAKYLMEKESGIPARTEDAWLNHTHEPIRIRYLQRADAVIEMVERYYKDRIAQKVIVKY